MLDHSLDPLAQTVALADDPVENGRAAVSLILDQKRPITAVLAGSDEIALGAKEGLVQHGLAVPRDVSVIGFQHQVQTLSASPLTCVCVDAVEVGRQLARSAIKRIESRGRDIPETIVPTVLVKRGSCRPLRPKEHMVL
jgi:DNA-binding LacI/PurR family transcriptional regulator